MPSFKAVLQVSGKQYDIYHSEYNLRQLIDELGRPASPTLGGGFVLDIEEPPETDSLIYDWMFSPTMQLNGQVVLWDMDKKMLKVVKFHHAFLVNFRSLFDGSGQGAGSPGKRTQLIISPQASDNNGQFHDNNWPAPDPIVDWDWAAMNEQCNPDAKKEKEPSALSEALHTALDVVGMIPVVGEIADGANALIYAAEGNYGEAALSAAAMIPIAGNVVGATKIGRRAVKVVSKAKALGKAKVARKLTAAQRKIATKLKKVAGHRASEGLPEYAPKPGSTGTVAHTRINGKDHYGYNSKIDDNFPRPNGKKRYSLSLEERREWFSRMKEKGLLPKLRSLGDAQFLSHAEAETLIKAAKEGKLPKVVDMFVDRVTCNNCREYLPALAKELGVEKLNIYYYLKDHPGFKHIIIDAIK